MFPIRAKILATVLVGISDFSPEREEQLVQKLLERRVDGLILTGETRSPAIYEKLRRNRVPFIITWRLTSDPSLPSVRSEVQTRSLSYQLYRTGLTARE